MRIFRFDGLRGVAALIVVASHFVNAFAPSLYFGSEGSPSVPSWENAFAFSPLVVVISGSFAVFVFFVLSGFVIAASACSSSPTQILGNCLGRILRLALPCTAAIIIIGCLGKLHLMHIKEVGALTGHWWAQNYQDDHPWVVIAKEAMGRYFLTGASSVDGVLWTMQRELIGSLGIYIGFGLFGSLGARTLLLVITSIMVVVLNWEPEYYLCFVAGSCLFLFRDTVSRLPSWFGAVAILLGLILGGRPFHTPESGTIYYHIYTSLRPRLYGMVWPCGAILLLFGTYNFSRISKVLGGNIGCYLGRISFGVYLIHFSLLQSLIAYLYIIFGQKGPLELMICALVYFTTVIISAHIFTVLVDEPGMSIARKLKIWVWELSSPEKRANPQPKSI